MTHLCYQVKNNLGALRAGCDLPGAWESSTYPFVLFDPVLEHYEYVLHECTYIDPTRPSHHF